MENTGTTDIQLENIKTQPYAEGSSWMSAINAYAHLMIKKEKRGKAKGGIEERKKRREKERHETYDGHRLNRPSDQRIPESLNAFCRMVSFTAAKTRRIFVVSVAWVKLAKRLDKKKKQEYTDKILTVDKGSDELDWLDWTARVGTWLLDSRHSHRNNRGSNCSMAIEVVSDGTSPPCSGKVQYWFAWTILSWQPSRTEPNSPSFDSWSSQQCRNGLLRARR